MSRDLRKFARDTNIRLVIGAILLLFIVGDGLIYLIYGSDAARFGFLCLCATMIPVVLIIATLFIMEIIVEHVKPK
jgi:hypothetical protein